MSRAGCIMVQGTMSGAGKSLLCAALCRIFAQDGYKTAPFKSQNMALNSFVTRDGLEMGRAQVVQAQAAGVEPDVRMNPILLKPSSDVGSQVIVNGEVRGDMPAKEYFRRKKSVRDRRSPRSAFPMAVKKVEDKSCTPFTITINRKVRMNKTANSKYREFPLPNREMMGRGKN